MSVVRANVRGRDMVGFVEAAQQKVAAELAAAAGLSAHLGRPVREPAARRRASLRRGAGRHRADLRAAVHHVRLGPPGATGVGQHPLRADRRRVRAGLDRRVSVRSGLGRIHRAARHRRAERRRAGLLFQPAPRPRPVARSASSSRAPGADCGRC